MPDPNPADQPPPHGLDLIGGLLAALLPGLGHVYRGELKRGVCAAVGVFGLFFSGMFIGGIDIVDSREDKWWFYGEALIGPVALGVNALHQNNFKAIGDLPQTATREAVLRSGFPNEQRVINAEGVAVWQELTPEQIAQGMGPPNRKSIARANELGMLFATIAGMLNLIVFLDALFPNLKPRGVSASGHAANPAAKEASA